jgi:hypothetical protein
MKGDDGRILIGAVLAASRCRRSSIWGAHGRRRLKWTSQFDAAAVYVDAILAMPDGQAPVALASICTSRARRPKPAP